MNNRRRTPHSDTRQQFWDTISEPPEPARRSGYRTAPKENALAQPLPEEAIESLEADISRLAEPFQEPEIYAGSHGRTMFDSSNSDDNTVTVLLPREQIASMPSQSLVRIKSTDDRTYLGIVVKGPFAEPDGLRADAAPMIITAVRGAWFMPNFHGRVQVELIGEELPSGAVEPPRFRPLPDSPVFVLDADDTARVLQTTGTICLGRAVGHAALPVCFPLSKAVLPRHTGILGTTGGGKSTTVSGLIAQLQQQGVATVLVDTEGEYTEMDRPTEDQRMIDRLRELGRAPAGVDGTTLYHLVGRETSNPSHPRRVPFSLRFSKISPYAVGEILEFSDAQEERFFKAYDLTKVALERLGIYPRPNHPEDREQAMETDEIERGWPGMTLQQLYDVVSGIASFLDNDLAQWTPAEPRFQSGEGRATLETLFKNSQLPKDVRSWRVLQGKLGRFRRLRIFDNAQARALDFEQLIQPGRVSVVDLSDTDSPQINNLTIAELLRGVMDHQDAAYDRAARRGAQPTPVVVFIEEAHEFLSAERIRRMQALFEQVARIARRGRKRWLGLVFITQLPQHLPDEVLGLVNNWVLHKISDANVVTKLHRSIGGVDDALWRRLPSLAPGQAIVSFGSMARPMLVAVDPTACKLRMVD